MSNTTADIVGEDPRIAHLENARADTERELSRVADELAHVRAVGVQALDDATAALVAAESRIAVEANRAAEMEAQANAELARADAAKRELARVTDDLRGVVKLRDAAIARAEKAEAHVGRIIDAVDCQMKSTGLPADLVDVVRGVAMETHLTTWRLAELERVCGDQQSRADAAERARDEVGIQLAAAQERLRLAGGLRDFAESPPVHWDVSADRQTMAARLDDAVATLSVDGRVEVRRDDGMLLARLDVHEHDGPVSGVLQDRADSQCEIAAALLWSHLRANKLDAVKAWDAVPGDALAPVVRGAPFDEAGTVNPDRITAALEANGIDTDNVKGVEVSRSAPSGTRGAPSGLAVRAVKVGWDPVDGPPLVSHLEALGIDTSNVKGVE